MTITVNSSDAETVKGVKINMKAFAQVKVKTRVDGKLDMASTAFLIKEEGKFTHQKYENMVTFVKYFFSLLLCYLPYLLLLY